MNDQQRAAMQMALETIETLWDIIDDIDTYGDMAKADEKLYRSLVERKQRERFKTGITTDGYTLNDGAITALREALAQLQGQIKCACGDAYPADSFGAGFIAATGRCQNCDMAQPQDHSEQHLNMVQGEWIDLTDKEFVAIWEETISDMACMKAVIAKFKEKNTPPFVPQGEPVAWMRKPFGEDVQYCEKPFTTDWTPLYTTPPSVEAAIEAALLKQQELWIQATEDGIEAAIEATKEKAAKVCEEKYQSCRFDDYRDACQDIAAAIRNMK